MQFTNNELNSRIEALRGYLARKQTDVAILSQTSDIIYYSGSAQPLYVVVPAEGDAFALARKGITRINTEVTHIGIEPFSGGKDLAAIFEKRGLPSARKIGMTLDTLSYTSATRMMKPFAEGTMADIAWDVRMLRTVKSEAEIAIQRRAGAVMAKVPEIVKASLEPGMTELELSALLESYFRLNGHGVIVRTRREGVGDVPFGVCSSGVNSLTGTKFEGVCAGAGTAAGSPYGAAMDVIAEGAPIIIDFGFPLEGYIIDQTRMASIGEPSDEVMQAYEDMLKVESVILDAMKPGAIWEDLYTLAANTATDMGYADTFMGSGTEQVKFVAHGVGLELDEPPYLAPDMKYPLEAGMVIAVEPKVALPGVGVVGIEDTVIVRDAGVEFITTAPREFIVS